MRLEGNMLYLSRRNLRTLLAKLDGAPAGSACTIGHPNRLPFYVTAEEDEQHYSHASRVEFGGLGSPGLMHPDTERVLEEDTCL